MSPVTLKRSDLVLTLSWVQYLLILTLLVVSILTLVNTFWLGILIPLVFWKYRRNKTTIKQQSSQHILLNAENQWYLVDGDSSQVTEAQLITYWLMPAFVAINLVTEAGLYCCIVLRKNFAAATFSRVVVGLHADENDTN